jgi:hypothetical protein
MLRVLPLLALLFAASPPTDCAPLQTAYQKLIGSTFTMERHLTIIVDGEKKLQETARIDYVNRKITRTVLNQDFTDGKKMDLNIEGDPALNIKFNCRNFEQMQGSRYRFRDEKGMDEILFALDTQQGVLIPLSWTANREARAFFIKKNVKLIGENKKFELKKK